MPVIDCDAAMIVAPFTGLLLLSVTCPEMVTYTGRVGTVKS